MKSTKLLASLSAVSLLCWAAGACSSSSGDDDDTATAGSSAAGKTGKAGSGNANGGEPGSDGGTSSTSGKGTGGKSGSGNTEAGASEGGNSSPVGNGGETNVAGAGGEGGSGATCDADLKTDPKNCGFCGHDCGGGECDDSTCQFVVVLDPAPRTVNSNTGLDVKNKVLIDSGTLFYWNYGYPDQGDYEYTILKTSVVPKTPPSDGLPAVQTFPILASPIEGATFNAGYLYYSIKTGATTAEVRRKKLDTSDAATPEGVKVNSLATSRIWRGLAFWDGAWYATGEVDTNMVDLLKTGIYKLGATVAAAPTVVTGLSTIDNALFDFTIVNGHMFWTVRDDDTTDVMLWTVPVAGGTPVKLDDVTTFGGASVAGDPDGTYVYWTSHHHGGALSRCPIAHLDTDHIEPVATVDNASEGLFVDDKYAYYEEDEALVVGKPVWRVEKTGGTPELLGESDGIALVGMDDGFVYVQNIDSVISRVSKIP